MSKFIKIREARTNISIETASHAVEISCSRSSGFVESDGMLGFSNIPTKNVKWSHVLRIKRSLSATPRVFALH